MVDCSLVDPKRCLCPFISTQEHSKCKDSSSGTVDLNRLSDLSLYINHLKKQHAQNPMAQIAVKRIQKAKRFQHIGPECSTMRVSSTGTRRVSMPRRSAP